MNLKRSLIAICFVTISFSAYSQAKFSFGPELGVNSSGLTYHYPVTARQDYAKETDKPIISPIVGLWTKLNFKRKLFLNVGVQYFQFGNKNSYHSEGPYLFISDPGSTYKHDSRTVITFQKIAIPVSLGREIKIRKVKGNVFLGVRENYLTKANLYGKYHRVNVLTNGTEEEGGETNINFFDKKNYPYSKRCYTGVFIGFGINVTKRINMSMSVATDRYIDLTPKGADIEEGYNKQDFALSIKYNLNKKL